MRTSPVVDFSVYDPAIKQDSTPSASSIQSFSKIADLEKPNTNSIYATYEPDFWVLDGRYKLMPTDTTNVHVGWTSAAMSGSGGAFSTSPVLTITFGSVQSVDGLTLIFSQQTGDWATDIDVAYYDASNALIQTDTYTPTTWEIYTAEAVASFKKIIITFNSTNKGYRYLRLQSIDYGEVIHFTSADIKSCEVVECIDPLSLTLPIGTLELTVFSSDAAFSIIDPTGLYANLQNNQPLDVYELVGNDQVYIGHFFLDDWENTSDNTILFKAVDTPGILEKIKCYFSFNPATETTVSTFLSSLFSPSTSPAPIQYEIDSSLTSVAVKGWISPNDTYRTALQKMIFSAGAYASCSRSGVLQIKPIELASSLSTFDYSLLKSDMGSRSLSLKDIVTGVEVVAYNYAPAADRKILFNDTLPVGTHRIIFSEPINSLAVTGATLDEDSSINYAYVIVATEGTVVLDGLPYIETKKLFSVYNTTLPSNVAENIIRIDNDQMANFDNGQTIAQRVYNYYQQRYVQKMKLYAPAAAVGNSVLADTLLSRQTGAIIEKMTLDLSGGFIAKTEITGVIIP